MKLQQIALSLLIAVASFTASFVNPNAQAQTVIGADPEMLTALKRGNLPKIKALVIRGENPAMTDFDGQNGITIAARNGNYEILDYLLQVNTPIDHQDKIGNTAVFWATEDGDYDMVAYLLNKGASVDIRNGRGLTPLMAAARAGFLDLVQLLVDHGADVTIHDYTGRSPLDWARDSRTPGVEQVLIQAGAQ
ncbi:MAG: ankyrin repeat domain-containing protein [Alphaproteobacteria bacterium]|nr:ankyrin repeat domain-containing protein [Alphaproteobacteria bacterium]